MSSTFTSQAKPTDLKESHEYLTLHLLRTLSLVTLVSDHSINKANRSQKLFRNSRPSAENDTSCFMKDLAPTITNRLEQVNNRVASFIALTLAITSFIRSYINMGLFDTH